MITLAPLSAAQRIAAASAVSGIDPSGFTTFATSSCDEYAIPTIPVESSFAAISPAMKVPCPSVSTNGLPPTKLFASTICPARSGMVLSAPESTIATFTGARTGGVGHASKAWSSVRYHCFGASGSAGVKAAAGAASRSAAVMATSSARFISRSR